MGRKSKTKEPDEYEVEKILDKEMTGGKTKYYVKWVGWDEPTWEKLGPTDCPTLIKEYEDSLLEKENKKRGSKAVILSPSLKSKQNRKRKTDSVEPSKRPRKAHIEDSDGDSSRPSTSKKSDTSSSKERSTSRQPLATKTARNFSKTRSSLKSTEPTPRKNDKNASGFPEISSDSDESEIHLNREPTLKGKDKTVKIGQKLKNTPKTTATRPKKRIFVDEPITLDNDEEENNQPPPSTTNNQSTSFSTNNQTSQLNRETSPALSITTTSSEKLVIDDNSQPREKIPADNEPLIAEETPEDNIEFAPSNLDPEVNLNFFPSPAFALSPSSSQQNSNAATPTRIEQSFNSTYRLIIDEAFERSFNSENDQSREPILTINEIIEETIEETVDKGVVQSEDPEKIADKEIEVPKEVVHFEEIVDKSMPNEVVNAESNIVPESMEESIGSSEVLNGPEVQEIISNVLSNMFEKHKDTDLNEDSANLDKDSTNLNEDAPSQETSITSTEKQFEEPLIARESSIEKSSNEKEPSIENPLIEKSSNEEEPLIARESSNEKSSTENESLIKKSSTGQQSDGQTGKSSTEKEPLIEKSSTEQQSDDQIDKELSTEQPQVTNFSTVDPLISDPQPTISSNEEVNNQSEELNNQSSNKSSAKSPRSQNDFQFRLPTEPEDEITIIKLFERSKLNEPIYNGIPTTSNAVSETIKDEDLFIIDDDEVMDFDKNGTSELPSPKIGNKSSNEQKVENLADDFSNLNKLQGFVNEALKKYHKEVALKRVMKTLDNPKNYADPFSQHKESKVQHFGSIFKISGRCYVMCKFYGVDEELPARIEDARKSNQHYEFNLYLYRCQQRKHQIIVY